MVEYANCNARQIETILRKTVQYSIDITPKLHIDYSRVLAVYDKENIGIIAYLTMYLINLSRSFFAIRVI